MAGGDPKRWDEEGMNGRLNATTLCMVALLLGCTSNRDLGNLPDAGGGTADGGDAAAGQGGGSEGGAGGNGGATGAGGAAGAAGTGGGTGGAPAACDLTRPF